MFIIDTLQNPSWTIRRMMECVNLGTFTLNAAPRNKTGIAEEQVTIEEAPKAPRPTQVQIAWDIMAELSAGQMIDIQDWPERERHLPAPVVTRPGRDGRFLTTGLVPALYHVAVSAPDCPSFATSVDLTNESGTVTLEPMHMLLEESFTNSIGMVFVRLSTIQHTDLILVVEQGRIREAGTHSELLTADGRYRQMVDLQTAPSEWRKQAAGVVDGMAS